MGERVREFVGGVPLRVSIADELDDLVARVVRTDGEPVDPAAVWWLVLQWALHRHAEATGGER